VYQVRELRPEGLTGRFSRNIRQTDTDIDRMMVIYHSPCNCCISRPCGIPAASRQ